jgi:hypothetical protein
LQPEVEEFPRGREILKAFPNTERALVESHWKIPGLHGFEGNIDDWINIKRSILVLGIKSSLSVRPNVRSSDFIAPSHAKGCAMACSYCYVPRRKGFANPITEFVNIEQILGYTRRHGPLTDDQGCENRARQQCPRCPADLLLCRVVVALGRLGAKTAAL